MFNEMIRILLVDDQSIVREGLASLLETHADLKIVGEAANGKIAVERSLVLKPDVILMDIRMPVMDGVAAIRSLTQQAPEIKILVLTNTHKSIRIYATIGFTVVGRGKSITTGFTKTISPKNLQTIRFLLLLNRSSLFGIELRISK